MVMVGEIISDTRPLYLWEWGDVQTFMNGWVFPKLILNGTIIIFHMGS